MRLVLIHLFCFLMVGCSSHPPVREEPKIEQKVAQSKILGEKIELVVAQDAVRKKSNKVIHFLNQTSTRVRSMDPEARFWTARVELIDLIDQKRHSFAFPGGALYLSVRNLRKLKYESEIAGMIAYYLAFLKNPKHEARYLFEDANITRDQYLLTTHEDRAAAVEQAMAWLHQTGYDPRGMITFFKVLGDDLVEQSLNASEVEDLISEAKRQYARWTPLLNPIVRTEAFLEIQKEFNKL